MNQPTLPGLPYCSPDMCLEILRIFSETNNGEATVLLMLRHISQMAGSSQATISLPNQATGRNRLFFSLGEDASISEPSSNGWLRNLEIPLKKDDGLLGVLILTDIGETENSCNDTVIQTLSPGLELLTLALAKWHDEKKQKLLLRKQELMSRRLKRQNSFLNSLYKISLDMVKQKNYNRLMNTILQHSQTILEANYASIYLLNERLNVMEMKFIGPNVDPSLLGLSIRRGEGGAGLVWTTGKFMVIQNYPQWGNRIQLPWLAAVGAIAFLPLQYLNKMIGIICLGFADPTRTISSSEKSMLQQFANLAAMVSENVRLLNGLERRDEEFTHDINLAAEVQQAYLPFNYDDPRLRVKTYFQPLHTVSGDLYDYYWGLKGDIISGFVADVTGHGVTAGLRTSALSALFREASLLALPPMEKMKWVHGHSLSYFSDGAYFVAVFFELDLSRHEMKIVCGGLYEFYLNTHYYKGRIQMTGSLMGLKRTPVFEERIYPANAGDCFYFLSDGFTEQIDPNSFPGQTFQETCDYLDSMRVSSKAWDDMAGLCIQLKSDKKVQLNYRPELQLYFVGFEEFHSARLQITEFVEQHFAAEADDILLAFHEAAGNALRHGSDIRPVLVRIQKYNRYMSIRVKDSGRGFDNQRYVANKRLERLTHSNPQAHGGRGIAIMLDCMDKVCFSALGNEVLMLKKTQNQ